MKNLRYQLKQYFENPDDPIIDELSRIDLEYIQKFMNRTTSNKKIHRVEYDTDRIDIFREDDEGITYFRKQ